MDDKPVIGHPAIHSDYDNGEGIDDETKPKYRVVDAFGNTCCKGLDITDAVVALKTLEGQIVAILDDPENVRKMIDILGPFARPYEQS